MHYLCDAVGITIVKDGEFFPADTDTVVDSTTLYHEIGRTSSNHRPQLGLTLISRPSLVDLVKIAISGKGYFSKVFQYLTGRSVYFQGMEIDDAFEEVGYPLLRGMIKYFEASVRVHPAGAHIISQLAIRKSQSRHVDLFARALACFPRDLPSSFWDELRPHLPKWSEIGLHQPMYENSQLLLAYRPGLHICSGLISSRAVIGLWIRALTH